MPTGKAPILGSLAWTKRAPQGFGPKAIASLLKWRKASMLEPSVEQIAHWKAETAYILGYYFGSLSTPTLTETERAKASKGGCTL